MNKIIDKLTTQPEIMNHLSFLNPSRVACFEEVQRKVQQTRNSKLMLDTVESICLSEHAVDRWNERVGPCVKEASLVGILTSLLLVPGAITLVNKEEGRIEDDIVFTYFMEKGKMVITTFYGRISLRPGLNNLQSLKKFNSCEHDSYGLTIPQGTLDRQCLPFIPDETIQYKGSKNTYLIQKYVNEEHDSCLFFCKITSGYITQVIKIDPNHPEISLLTRRALSILSRLGYEDFVMKHLMYHKPEAVTEIRRQSLLKELSLPMNISFASNFLPLGLIPNAPTMRRVESEEFVQVS